MVGQHQLSIGETGLAGNSEFIHKAQDRHDGLIQYVVQSRSQRGRQKGNEEKLGYRKITTLEEGGTERGINNNIHQFIFTGKRNQYTWDIYILYNKRKKKKQTRKSTRCFFQINQGFISTCTKRSRATHTRDDKGPTSSQLPDILHPSHLWSRTKDKSGVDEWPDGLCPSPSGVLIMTLVWVQISFTYYL